MSTPTRKTPVMGAKHRWSSDEMMALHLLYEYYQLPSTGKIDDTTDEATLIMTSTYEISSNKKKTKTALFRSTYRDKFTDDKNSNWWTIVRPNRKDASGYTKDELDDFRRVNEQIKAAAKSLGIELSGDGTRSPFGHAADDVDGNEDVEDAWTVAEKFEILFQIIAANNKKIPWDKIDMPEGRTIKAVQVMFDEEKAKVRKSTKAKASVDGNEEVVDETSAIAAEEVEAAADRPVNKIAAVPTPSSRQDETEGVENGGQDEASGTGNETEA